MMSSAGWDGQDQPMAPPEDDFHQFLDMSSMGNMGDGMQFDFHGFQDSAAHSFVAQQRDPTDAIMTDPDTASNMIPRTEAMMQNQSAPITQAPIHPSIPSHMMGQPAQADPISNIDAQIQYLQQQKLQQQQRQLEQQRATFYANHNHSVPPTPQSLEMTPAGGQYYSQAEQVHSQGVFDSGYRRSQEQPDMTFTPLVSPAVTPLDPHFNIDSAFHVPGAYFSPLTSPALVAQRDLSAYDPSTHSNNSPVEIDLDPPATANADLSKKTRRQSVQKVRGKTNFKHSPISKPMRRKTGPSPAIVSQVLSEVEEANFEGSEPSLLPMPAASTEGSEENASVSPENLTDMPPPPVPARRSTSKSPYIQAQTGSSVPVGQGLSDDHLKLSTLQQQQSLHPATPTSLMKLPASKGKKQQSSSQQEPSVTDHIESLELPESVSSHSMGPVNVQPVAQLLHLEPAPAQHSAPKPGPSPSIIKSSGISSATQSPQLRPGSSGPSARKTPQLSARNSRKRSTGSVHVSPALLPRISPNIKPLLPGTPGMSSVEDTASRLLMSKSNYQNILEGNTVPGVSYPSELSTNLTSKRTSHKIAEQGRRNRINSALQVMAGLLPDQGKSSGDDAEKKDSKQANAPNSKASVVENAIIHMQNLERENVDLKQELQELKEQLEKLKKPST